MMAAADILWTISFLVGFALVLGAVMVFWIALRDNFVGGKLINWRKLVFALGFLVLAGVVFFVESINSPQLLGWMVLESAIGIFLISISLFNKKWEYFLFVFAPLIYLIPVNSVWFVFLFLPVFFLSYITYKNYHLLCDSTQECNEAEAHSAGKKWAIVLIALALVGVNGALNGAGVTVVSSMVFGAINSSLEALAVFFVYRHIWGFTRFSRKEKILLPMLFGYVFVLTGAGFMTNYYLGTYMEKDLAATMKSNIAAVKEIMALTYPGDDLGERVKNRDTSLNDLTDKVFARTGIRSVIYLGNERIASAPSATGKGRYLGTVLENEDVTNTVLKGGQDYSGKIAKGGELLMAAYTPIYSHEKVIGMVGTGRMLNESEQVRKELTYRIIAGGGFVMLLSLGVILYDAKAQKK